MINCPYCGQPVLEGQKFCGSCGKDVQAAVRAAPVASNPSPAATSPFPGNAQAVHPAEEQATPYAYSQPTGYDYEGLPPAQPPMGGRMAVIIGAVVLALCCTFACGLLFGFEIIPTTLEMMGVRGAVGPTPRPTPTPASLLPVIQYLFHI